MAESIFELNNVSFVYNRKYNALKNITLSIDKGELVAVIGANGTGKSTLLSLLDGLIFPSTGTFKAYDNIVTEQQLNDFQRQLSFRKKVGFVFQNPDIQLFCPTVKEDILFGPLQLGLEKKEIHERFEKIVECMKISHLLERSPHQLSIGEKKKIAIASVLVIQPDVLLLDEPTAGLDPQTTRDIIAILFNEHNAGKTIIFATHDLHIVEEMAEKVHVFGADHSIIRSGKTEEILLDQKFLQENNLIHIHIHRHLHVSHLHSH
jgi:cobalt/nickel transport system ATP-binding protein